jgi:hypothetical protein
MRTAWHIVPVILCLVLASAGHAWSQAPYLGGSADGYAQSSTRFMLNWDPVEEDSIRLFPSPLRKGETAHVAVLNVQGKLEVILQNAHGATLWQNILWGAQEQSFMDIPTEKLTPGTYLVEVRCDGNTQTRKLIVLSK